VMILFKAINRNIVKLIKTPLILSPSVPILSHLLATCRREYVRQLDLSPALSKKTSSDVFDGVWLADNQ
ncbi:hypothetical protein, partial [Huaxiibacter chinensis]|uniref:hypothetical protein n=1 Tax=Huaxiibacter chinensis TaxID=2899785 RepID=UPI003D31A35E